MKKNYVIYYDGFCNLCSSIISILKKKDRNKVFLFFPLTRNNYNDFSNTKNNETLIFTKNQTTFYRSDAILEISRIIGFPFSLFLIFKIFPKSIRDHIYSFISRYRYNIFGKKSSCEFPQSNTTNNIYN